MPRIDDSFTRTNVGMLLLNFAGLLLAWICGKLDLSMLWIIGGSLAWWFALRRNEKNEKRTLIYDSLKADERATVMAGIGELPAWVFFPDMERCEWLNRVIHQLWPHIGKYAEKYIISSVEPVMQRSLPLSFKFVKIDLGDDALRIGGIKVYKEHTARGELIMDMEIFYAGDAQIKFRTGRFTAGIKDIQCHGTLRVICKPLIDDMPFVGGVTAFFLQTPVIDFNLTNLADAFDLPGVADIIRKVVYEQVNRMFVLPNKFSLALVPDVSQYELKFTEPDGVLRIHLPSARDLMKKDISVLGKGKSDPYCIIRIGSQEFKTKVIANNVAPQWDQWFEAIVDQVAGQTMEIEVLDEDPGSADDFLGRCSVDIIAVAKQGSVDQWMPLEDAKHGQLRVRAFWLGVSGKHASNYLETAIRETMVLTSSVPLGTSLLMVYFDSAQALPVVRKSPTEPHPYLQVTCGNESYKTFTQAHTCNPVWEEQKIFIIHDPRTQYMKIEVMDEKSTKRLGYIDFAVAALMEKSDMQMNAPFSLHEAGTESRLNLRLKLRMLAMGSLDSAGVATSQSFAAVMNDSASPAPIKGVSARPAVSQSAVKHSDTLAPIGPYMVPTQQYSSHSAHTTPIASDVGSSYPIMPTPFNLTIRSPTPSSAGSGNAASVVTERETIVTSTTSTALVDTDGRAMSPVSIRSTTSSTMGDGHDGLRRRSGYEPRMRLTVAHDRNKQVLSVTVHECSNLDKLLKHHAVSHFDEPYVSVHLLPSGDKRKTPEYEKHRADQTNPKFECTLEFPCEHEARLRGCSLSLKVKYKKGLFSKVDTLGSVKVSLDPIAETGPLGLRDWYDIDADFSDDEDSKK